MQYEKSGHTCEPSEEKGGGVYPERQNDMHSTFKSIFRNPAWITHARSQWRLHPRFVQPFPREWLEGGHHPEGIGLQEVGVIFERSDVRAIVHRPRERKIIFVSRPTQFCVHVLTSPTMCARSRSLEKSLRRWGYRDASELKGGFGER